MPLSRFLIALLKDNYLDYRQGVAATAGRFSARMLSQMSVLNSQLATRARIEPSQLTAHNKNIVKQVALQKRVQGYDNQVAARKALMAFLRPGRTDSQAQSLNDELEWVAGYLLAISPTGVK